MNWSDLPQEYRDLANVRPDAFIQETEDILARYILAFLPKGISFWVKCWEATTVSELPPISKSISQEQIQKDVALFVAFFYYEGDHKYRGSLSLLGSFDVVYNLATQFVEKYPPNLNWEEQENDYESTAHQFILDNFIHKDF